MRTILLVTDREFWDVRIGSERRIANLVDHLVSREYRLEVVFVGYPPRQGSPIPNNSKFKFYHVDSINFFEKIVRRIVSTPYIRVLGKPAGLVSRRATYLYHRFLKNRLSQAPFHLDPRLSKRCLRLFRAVCAECQPQIVIFEYLRLSYLIKGLDVIVGRAPKTFVDTHDVLSLRADRFRSAGFQSNSLIDQDLEADLLRKFDVIIAIQGEERRAFEQLVPEAKIIVVGHASDIIPPRFRDSTPVRIGYVGTLNEANSQAVSELVNRVWPAVRRSYSNVQLDICGDICGCRDLVDKDPTIRLHGRLPDLDNFYDWIDIAVNPVITGSGLKIKNVEAICHSKPLVTTSIGAEGMEDGIGKGLLVCDTPNDQISAILALVKDPNYRYSLAKGAYSYAQDAYVPDRAYSELIQEIELNPPQY